MTLDFSNVENAFAGRSDKSLTRAYWLFRIMSSNVLVTIGPSLLNAALLLKLPVKGLIKQTIFRHFCGGEDIEECNKTIEKLYGNKVCSILDYSAEGSEGEENFDKTCKEIIATVHRANGDKKIPFCVFKPTGLARFALLEKVSSGSLLSGNEQQEWNKAVNRINKICKEVADNGVKIFIDAEESWIQEAVDQAVLEMMRKYNRSRAVVYNTIQLYRTDRLQFLKHSFEIAEKENFILGVKLVRGAYMEKERARASKMNYPSPIHPDKKSSDSDFNEALRFSIEHIDRIAVCAGTHNETSSALLVELMNNKNISADHPHCFFSQLLGMSDHISNNLALAGYNVAKYVPYGPVESVIPYLIRRARENTSVKGQTGRELSLIKRERERRRMKMSR